MKFNPKLDMSGNDCQKEGIEERVTNQRDGDSINFSVCLFVWQTGKLAFMKIERHY